MQTPPQSSLRAFKVASARRPAAGLGSKRTLEAGTPAAAAAAPDAPFTNGDFAALSKLIDETPPERIIDDFDLDPKAKNPVPNPDSFFNKVYRYKGAADMLKLIMGRPENVEKNRRLGEVRKYFDWSRNQGVYANAKKVTIENTNQGKDNGARSDLDATANILGFDEATGKWQITENAVAGLIEHQKEVYRRYGLTPEGVDVTIFNGDEWIPDWSDQSMRYDEFKRRLFRNTFNLKNRGGAYFVPGANKEQAHDRALSEGHSIHIGWDVVKDLPTINGRTIKFNRETGRVVDVETNQPIEEYNTREMASGEKGGIIRRYANVKALEKRDTWRRSAGNLVQNAKEFLTHHEPISRTKYFIERAIDQAAGRFVDWSELSFMENLGAHTHLSQNTYVEVHGSNLDPAVKNAWKKAFIQQAFGIAASDAARIKEIQSVIDRSSEIQLDKTKKWHHGQGADYMQRRSSYYSEEMADAQKIIDQNWETILKKHENLNRRIPEQNAERQRIRAENATKKQGETQVSVGPDVELQAAPDKAELVLKEAERRFVEKQRNIMIEGGVRVIEESLRRDFTREGIRRFASLQNKNQGQQNIDSETRRKILLERGAEVALLLDAIETVTGLEPEYRTLLRNRVVNAVPIEAQSLVAKLAKICELKLKLVGGRGFEKYTTTASGMSEVPASELLNQIEEETRRLLGDEAVNKPSPKPEAEVRGWLLDAIHDNLGPIDGEAFNKAWEQGKRGLILRFGAKAYWKEIVNQFDFLTVTGTALGMVNAYQQHCANQADLANEECLLGLAWEAGNQTLGMLPGVNTGVMILNGLKAIKEGDAEGSLTLGLGIFSIPQLARMIGMTGGAVIKLYVVYNIYKLGYAVTAGYALHRLESDILEQAFKAMPRPGFPGQRYDYANQPATMLQAETPTTPLLSDKIKVDADSWNAERKYNEAKKIFAAAIQSELDAQKLKPEGDEWNNKRAETIQRYADLLPYQKRVQQFYKVFSTEIEPLIANLSARGLVKNEDKLEVCLDRTDEDIIKKYGTPRTFWEWGRWWRGENKSEEKDSDEAYAGCLQRAIAAHKEILTAPFNRYLDQWLSRQDPTPRLYYDTPERRELLIGALVRHYLTQRHLDLGFEEARHMKKVALKAKGTAEARLNLAGNLKQAYDDTTKKLGETIQQAAAKGTQGDPEVKAEIKLRAPRFAVRLGDDAPVDIKVRGQYYSEDQKNKWNTVVTSEITSVTLERPDNLVLTEDLERQAQNGGQPRRFVTINEKLTGELRDGQGNKLATAETTVRYYDLLPNWRGVISVEIVDREGKSYRYWGKVKISGPVRGESVAGNYTIDYGPGRGNFLNLPPGTYTITVEPHEADPDQSKGTASVTLRDYSAAYPMKANLGELDGWGLTFRGKDASGKEGEFLLASWKDGADISVQLGSGDTDTASTEKARIDAARQIGDYNRDVKAGRTTGPIVRAKGAPPKVEAIPEDTEVANPRTRPSTAAKPTVESIPEDTNVAGSRSHPSTAAKPTVEAIPEDTIAPGRRATTPPRTPTRKPVVEKVPEPAPPVSRRNTTPDSRPPANTGAKPNTGGTAGGSLTRWQLGPVQFKDHYNGWAQNAGLLKIMRQEATSLGGVVDIEVARQGGGGVCRYSLKWTFGKDVGQIAYSDTATPVNLSIVGDGGPCVETNTWMEFQISDAATMDGTAIGKRFNYNPRGYYHDTTQRSFRVKTKDVQKTTQFQIVIHIVVPGREETLRLLVTYPYEGKP